MLRRIGLITASVLSVSVGLAFDPASDERLAEVKRLLDAGQYSQAETAGRALLRQVEDETGPDAPEVAAVLHPLVTALMKGGKNAEPETVALAERAVSIRERHLGPDDPDLGRSLSVLGSVLYLNADYARTQPVLERSLAILEKALGHEDPAVAAVTGGLANLHADLGDYTRARELYERAIAIEGKNGTTRQLAVFKGNLATVLLEMDDSVGAAGLLEEVILVYEKELGLDHPELANALGNLSEAVENLGDIERSRSLEERALRIREARLGPDHRILAHSLTHLGQLLTQQGDLDSARPLLERALAIREKSLGPDHPLVAETLVALADLRGAAQDRGGARPLYERALAIREARLGPDHPAVARCLNKMALLDFADRRQGTGIERALRAVRIAREQFMRTVSAVSEREAVDLSNLLSESVGTALTGLTTGPPDHVPDATAVWDALVRSRAIVLDEMARRNRRLHERGHPEIDAAAAALTEARSALARLLLAGPQPGAAAEIAARFRQAKETVDEAERALARVSADYRDSRRRATFGLADVRRALPRDAALVAYASTDAGYLAFVQRSDEERPGLVRLGATATIDRLIEDWHGRVGVPPRDVAGLGAYREAGAALRAALWDPVSREAGKARTVFIVPDAAINTVSFATLPLDGDRYLVEGSQRVHYLSTERDLAGRGERARTPSAGAGGALVLGGPDFEHVSDPSSTMRAARSQGGAGDRDGGAPEAEAPAYFRGALPDCAGMRELRFPPLPGAEAEARAIEKLWQRASPASGSRSGDIVELTGGRAAEDLFKAYASGRSVLHLATHTFWVQGGCGGRTEGRGRLPLQLTGLALAGANQRPAAGQPSIGEDGILTAEEIASLDLRAADWVVVSGCQSGLGFVRRGEGVFGLRRAFEVAGAGTLILSLWPVSDQDTRDWMSQLYAARLAGADTPASVETATRRVLDARRRAKASTHPFFWGAFVAAGDWN